MVGALFCPICQLFLVWIPCNAHYITFQEIHLQPYFKIASVKSVLWPDLINNVVDVSLSSGNFNYWTACNHGIRYCTLPYGVLDNLRSTILYLEPVYTGAATGMPLVDPV